MKFLLPVSLAWGALTLTAGTASADCSSGAEYGTTVKANTVEVYLSETSRTCGGAIPMIRQNTQTGQVAQLAGYCLKGRYVDECVPAGIYRYGFATPYDCSERGCAGVAYYVEVTVPTAAPVPCTLTSGNSAPTDYSGPVPWASSTSNLLFCPSGSGCSAVGRDVLGFEGVLVGLSAALLLRRRRASRG